MRQRLLILGLAAGLVVLLPACGGTHAGDASSEDDLTAETREQGVSGPEGDRLIIEQLEQAGADLDQPREVNHYGYFDQRDGADRAADLLEGEGFDVQIDEVDGQASLTATRTEVVSLLDMRKERVHLEAVMSQAGGGYDGWEAAAKP